MKSVQVCMRVRARARVWVCVLRTRLCPSAIDVSGVRVAMHQSMPQGKLGKTLSDARAQGLWV